MWTTFSVSRWICLLSLAVVMLCSASDGQFSGYPCCYRTTGRGYKPRGNVKQCFIQERSFNCNINAYIIITSKGMVCLKANNQWLQKKRRQIKCTPLISKSKRRFKDLDENDVE